MTLDEIRDKILHIADQTIKYARNLNIPAAEAYVYNLSNTNLTDNKGKIDSRDGLTQGIGLRVAIGKQVGFASCTGFEKETIKSTLKHAHSIAKVSPENPMFNGFVAGTNIAKEGILDPEILQLDSDSMIETCNLMSQEIDLSDRRIVSISYGVNYSFGGYAVATTEGCLASSLITTYAANSFSVVTEADDRKTAGDFVQGREIKSIEGISSNGLKKALNSLGSKAFGGSEVLPTVWEPRESAAFLAFSFINCVSGSSYVEKSNPWGDKLDQQVAVKELTLIDDGQQPESDSGRAIDSEGSPKQTTSIIDDGILKTFLFDKMFGEAADKATTGNASRGGFFGGIPYENVPNVGPNKLLIENVGRNLEHQISEIDKGILLTGTPIGLFTANQITGDFSITTNDAFLIEKGEVVHPLKNISIAGNYFETLNDIRTIGSDREVSGWPLDAPAITYYKLTFSD